MFALVLSNSLPGALFAQEVAKVSKAKGQVLVHQDDVSAIKKGQDACIKDNAGKKLVCGKVLKKQKGKVLVKISDPSKLTKIKKGMSVSFGGTSPSKGASDAAESATNTGRTKNPMVLRVIWVPVLMGPVTYNKVAYSPPTSTTAGQSVLWTSDLLVKTSYMAFGADATIPIGQSLGVVPGVRYRSYTGSSLETDYDPEQKQRFAAITQTMTAIGLWTDVQVMRIPFGASSGMTATGGLDFEMSTATLKATKNDDRDGSEAELANVTSKLSVISLRLGAGFDAFFMGPAGATAGLNLLVPLAAMGASSTATTDDEFSSRSADDVADLTAALNHKKASFGVELVFGLGLTF